jgi:hypothetical protein
VQEDVPRGVDDRRREREGERVERHAPASATPRG